MNSPNNGKPQVFGPMSVSDTKAHNKTLKPECLLAKQIAEVIADGSPLAQFSVIQGPDAGMVVATSAKGRRIGVNYQRCRAESGAEVVHGWRYQCKVRHQVFQGGGLISLADLGSEQQRKMFAASIGQRMIEMKDGTSLSDDKKFTPGETD